MRKYRTVETLLYDRRNFEIMRKMLILFVILMGLSGCEYRTQVIDSDQNKQKSNTIDMGVSIEQIKAVGNLS